MNVRAETEKFDVVPRANALKTNISLYYTASGRRNTLKYVDAPVARNAWHTLRVDYGGNRVRVALDGKWTKADSVTSFDDFSYGSAK